MDTHEERLTTVEYGLKQFKTETIKAYQDVAMELAMLKGLTEDAVKRLMVMRNQTNERFDSVDQQLAGIKQDIGEVYVKFDHLENRFDRLENLIIDRLPPK
jgi:predicted  nucleic acid-binding Zn-ribbon protein